MKNKRLAKLVRNRPEKYPHELERNYERVFERIMDAWGTARADQIFLDLLVDVRGTRHGFPVKVAEEIYFLSELHSLTFDSKGEARIADEALRITKADERTREFRAVLEERGFKFVPSELFCCISSGDLANVVMFVNAGMEVDTLNEQGWTPLMVALFEGQEKVALFLIRKGADPFFIDPTGYRPIHWAAFQGYVSVIHELVERRVGLDVKTNFGWTPLLQAASRGYTTTVDTLATLGADVNLRDNEGWTPLHKACANGHEEVVSVFLLHGAKVDARHPDGRTALHIAVEHGHDAIVGMLLAAGADVKATDANGATALHIAAARNDIAVIDRLLSAGARRSLRDRHGVTPLMYAVEAGAVAAIRRFIAAGAEIAETLEARAIDRQAVPGRTGHFGRVAAGAARLVRSIGVGRRDRLHDYVARNDFLRVRSEVARGADPNAMGPDGLTPLEIAAANGHHNMWGVLIDLGAGRRQGKRWRSSPGLQQANN
jgi:uncharacterized protein